MTYRITVRYTNESIPHRNENSHKNRMIKKYLKNKYNYYLY